MLIIHAMGNLKFFSLILPTDIDSINELTDTGNYPPEWRRTYYDKPIKQ
jgi:hypothetical protein